MSLRIGDKVVIYAKVYHRSVLEQKESRRGTVVNLKWNLVQINFEEGSYDWVDCRLVHLLNKP